MPRDDKDEKGSAAPALGRTFRGQESPPITTPEAIVTRQERAAERAAKPGAVSIQVYFASRGLLSPIHQASMLAHTEVRTAPPEDFDEIFADYHAVPAPKPAEETKRP